MPKNLNRYYGRGELHFVTFGCYRRLPLLATAYALNFFVKELDEVRHECDFLLVGYVLMPNHVHLLLSEPKKCSPSSALQMLKQRVSRKMRGQQEVVPLTELRTPVAKHIGEPPGFWQPRFYDFNV